MANTKTVMNINAYIKKLQELYPEGKIYGSNDDIARAMEDALVKSNPMTILDYNGLQDVSRFGKLKNFFSSFVKPNADAAQATADAAGTAASTAGAAAAPAAEAATAAAGDAAEAMAAKGAETAGGLKGMLAKLKGSKLGSWAYKNPAGAVGLGLGGAANLAGLFDNNKVGGQLIGAGAGAGLGALASHLLGRSLNVPGYIGAALLGGGIGSGIDMLRANKEKQRQYAANPVMRNGMVQLLPNDDTMYVTPEEWQRMQGA